jgi:hypothetical protein
MVAVLAGACDGIPSPPSAPVDDDAAEAKSSEAMVEEMLAALAPLTPYAGNLPPEFPVDPAIRDTLRTQFQDFEKQYGATEQGRNAIETVVRDLEDRLKPLRDEGRAHVVLVLCDVIETLEPKSSKLARYREWASVVKNRPLVAMRGWYKPLDVPGDVVYFFVDVFLPDSGQLRSMAIRPGEEFLDLRFRKILGDNSGMLLEYIPTGNTFEVHLK